MSKFITNPLLAAAGGALAGVGGTLLGAKLRKDFILANKRDVLVVVDGDQPVTVEPIHVVKAENVKPAVKVEPVKTPGKTEK